VTTALLALLALALTACSSSLSTGAAPAPSTPDPAVTVGSTTDATYPRTVEHALGTAEIPAAPQRIVAITGTAELDPLLLLGHPPVGAAVVDEELNDFSEHLNGLTDGIERMSSRRGINLEEVASHRPDLILGTVGWLGDFHNQLEEIAPTVAVDDSRPWQDVLRLVAQTVDEEEAAEAHIDEVDARVAALAEQHRDTLAGTTYTLLLPSRADGQNYVYVNTDVNELLNGLGMRPTEQVLSDTPADQNYVEYSLEQTEPLASDLVLAYSYGDAEGDDDIAAFVDSPVNQSLPAVAGDRVVTVNSAWWYLTSAVGIERVLDELESDVIPLLEPAS
jgi:iron complex transport system substrate-binding protein